MAPLLPCMYDKLQARAGKLGSSVPIPYRRSRRICRRRLINEGENPDGNVSSFLPVQAAQVFFFMPESVMQWSVHPEPHFSTSVRWWGGWKCHHMISEARTWYTTADALDQSVSGRFPAFPEDGTNGIENGRAGALGGASLKGAKVMQKMRPVGWLRASFKKGLRW